MSFGGVMGVRDLSEVINTMFENQKRWAFHCAIGHHRLRASSNSPEGPRIGVFDPDAAGKRRSRKRLSSAGTSCRPGKCRRSLEITGWMMLDDVTCGRVLPPLVRFDVLRFGFSAL